MMDLFITLVLPIILGMLVSLFLYTITKHHNTPAFTLYAVFSGFMVFRGSLCLGLIVSDSVSAQLSASGADKVVFYDACFQQVLTSFHLFSFASFVFLLIEIVFPIIRSFLESKACNKEERDNPC